MIALWKFGDIKMTKNGLGVMKFFPVLALAGALTTGTNTSHAYDGSKHVFKFVELTGKASAGYENTQLKMRTRIPVNSVIPLATGGQFSSGVFVERSLIESRAKAFRTDGKLTVAAVDGSLQNTFVEAYGGYAWHNSEKKKRTAYFEFTSPRFSHVSHFQKKSNNTNSNARNYDFSIAAGYDLAKLWNPWKNIAFKPFGGYGWFVQQMSKLTLPGTIKLPINPATGTLAATTVATNASVKNAARWSGLFGGAELAAAYQSHTLWGRGEYFYFNRVSTKATVEIVGNILRYITKRSHNSYGYKAAGGYVFELNQSLSLYADAEWSKFMSKKHGRTKEPAIPGKPGNIDKTTLKAYKFMGGASFSV
jgi:outer membrane protein Pom